MTDDMFVFFGIVQVSLIGLGYVFYFLRIVMIYKSIKARYVREKMEEKVEEKPLNAIDKRKVENPNFKKLIVDLEKNPLQNQQFKSDDQNLKNLKNKLKKSLLSEQ